MDDEVEESRLDLEEKFQVLSCVSKGCAPLYRGTWLKRTNHIILLSACHTIFPLPVLPSPTVNCASGHPTILIRPSWPPNVTAPLKKTNPCQRVHRLRNGGSLVGFCCWVLPPPPCRRPDPSCGHQKSHTFSSMFLSPPPSLPAPGRRDCARALVRQISNQPHATNHRPRRGGHR